MTWVYRQTEPGLYTVGYYEPAIYDQPSDWCPDMDFDNRDSARARCHYLNGGSAPSIDRIYEALEAIAESLQGLAVKLR